MELHEQSIEWHHEDGSTSVSRYVTVREPSADAELHITRVWVDASLAFNISELRVEYIDYRVAIDDHSDRSAPQRVVRWQGELIAPPLLADPQAVWVHTQDESERRDTIEDLRHIWFEYREEDAAFRAQWSFPSYALGDHEEG